GQRGNDQRRTQQHEQRTHAPALRIPCATRNRRESLAGASRFRPDFGRPSGIRPEPGQRRREDQLAICLAPPRGDKNTFPPEAFRGALDPAPAKPSLRSPLLFGLRLSTERAGLSGSWVILFVRAVNIDPASCLALMCHPERAWLLSSGCQTPWTLRTCPF